MLYELFSWMEDNETEIRFNNKTLTKQDWQNAETQALSLQRMGFSALYQVKAEASSPKNTALIQKHKRFVEWLDFVKTHEHYSLYAQALLYLLSAKEQAQACKITALFKALVKDKPEEAKALYTAEFQTLHLYPEVEESLNITDIIKDCQALTKSFSQQEHALDVSMLLRPRIEDAEPMAAALLWLCQRNLPVEQIIQSGLLHDFALYHLVSLSEANNPIQRLYRYLYHFEESKALAELAETYRCETRGFERYTLSGVLQQTALLKTCSIYYPAIKFSINAANFEQLYQSFGLVFLQLALVFEKNTASPEWGSYIKDLINKEDMRPKLIQLIKTLALVEPKLLEALASQIQEETLERLLEGGEGAVLHLLPYKIYLSSRIKEPEVRHYLATLKEKDKEALDTIPALLALFKLFKITNTKLANNIYEALLELSFIHPECYQDDDFIKILKKFPNKHGILLKNYQALERKLNSCIEQHTQSEARFNYHAIEDCWRESMRQLALLEQIEVIANRMPHDIYTLQCQVTQKLIQHADTSIPLSRLISAFGLEQGFSQEDIKPYERLLIELISQIDVNGLRTQIIACFEAEPNLAQKWIHNHYADRPLWARAIEYGNLGLLQWLEDKLHPSTSVYRQSIKKAAEAAHWELVIYFIDTQQDILKRKNLNTLLSLAAQQGQLSALEHICQRFAEQIKNKDLDLAFDQALYHEQICILSYLLQHKAYTAADARIISALKKAVQLEAYELIKTLVHEQSTQAILKSIDSIFVKAACSGKTKLMQALCRADHLAPKASSQNKAILKAAQKGHVDVLSILINTNTAQTLVEEALSLSITAHQNESAQFLCCQQQKPLSMKGMEQALMQACKHHDLNIIKILIEKSETRPRLFAVEQALISAIKAKDTNISDYLLKQPNHAIRDKTINLALYIALKNKNPALVKILCPHAAAETLNHFLLQSIKEQLFNISRIIIGTHSPNQAILNLCIKECQDESLKNELIVLKNNNAHAEQGLKQFGFFAEVAEQSMHEEKAALNTSP